MEVLDAMHERDLPNGATLRWGPGADHGSVTFYKKVQVSDGREVGVFPLDLPPT